MDEMQDVSAPEREELIEALLTSVPLTPGAAMSEATYTCKTCGRVEVVKPDGRGFPPDIAKRRLQRSCKDAGCEWCVPEYRAGLLLGPPPTGQETRHD